MKKTITAAFLVFCLLLAGCGKNDAVFVQSVSELAGLGGIAPSDKFSAMVVSKHTTEVKKDSDKSVAELFVKEGDDVKEGDPLFAYDTDELSLAVEKLTLERDQLTASIENYTNQIAQLEKESKSAWGNSKLQYTIQIQSLQVDLKEAELNSKAKERDVERAQDLLENAVITAPTPGRVQSINESGTDSEGNAVAYITIQEAGAYRVKAVLNELQRGGVTEGMRVVMVSRTDSSQTWGGVVQAVDYENPIKNQNNNGFSDEMSSSSKYPFYVELDSTDGLLMGQHLYLSVESGESGAGICIDASFICDAEGSAYVWAEKRGKLEKRSVTLGQYDDSTNTYPVLEGLTLSDYIAFPDSNLCHSGASTTRVAPVSEESREEYSGEEIAQMPDGEALEEFLDSDAFAQAVEEGSVFEAIENSATLDEG